MNETTEKWKSVLGFEGRYEVSTLGRVRAIYEGAFSGLSPGRILKPQPQRNSYLFVTLYNDGGGHKRRSVHSLVLEAFRGARPHKNVSRHLDRNRANNALDNLAWGTSADNAADAKKHGTFVVGELNGFAKLTEPDVIQIRQMRDDGIPCSQIAAQFNVHWSNAWLIGKRKTWTHVQSPSATLSP